ncbi:MAG: ATP-binding protein [Nostoc sp. DedVER02]|uniref:ATP-binding protein n=2 Tax=unclassified Nostoc TaxID=2593658 RepID=UPI002AD413AA|nr:MULTISPECIES: ATP-binding protein [unclassified Nostoc]MDZ7988833.1 ATP-binding protein [Nostoc sp. DedVER02]MDZ8116372.1 ATP-binding protein [Nostoc sp. DedVER01b]
MMFSLLSINLIEEVMNSPQFSLPPYLFAKAFPFHIVFNRELKIIQVGEVLQRIHPEPLVNSLIEQQFHILRPNIQINFTTIAKRINSLFLFESLHNGMILKGQMMYAQEQDIMFFICSVWVNHTDTLANCGLKLTDFATHDQTVDLIFLLKAKNTALEDIQNLTDQLMKRQVQLKNALQVQEYLAHTAETQAQQLENTLQELQQTQSQLIQTEKMSSLGQLVAGIAHEINNPVNFIYGNLKYLKEYTQDLLSLIHLYQEVYPQPHAKIEALSKKNDINYIIEDITKILSSVEVGANRIYEIVLNLRNFSRLDEVGMKSVDIHQGIDSTLLILQHSLKGKLDYKSIEIIKEYGDLPLVECHAGQINQVFMNILSNAIDAMRQHEKEQAKQGIIKQSNCITIRTQVKNQQRVTISIKDNGLGMTEEVKAKLFDPFFTTKPVGQGTGLGLSISYQIVVKKHGGQIQCISAPGQGAEFIIEIPLTQMQSVET